MTDKIKNLPDAGVPPIRTDTRQDTVESVPDPQKPKKPNIFKRVWNWIDGKKTYIGFGLEGLGWLIPGPYGLILKCLGGLIIPVGIAHKLTKSNKVAGKSGELKLGNKDLIALMVQLWGSLKESFLIIKEILSRVKRK